MVTALGPRDGGMGTSDDHPEPPSPSPTRRWYRRPVLLSVLGVVVVGLGIAVTWFAIAWSDRGAREASLEDAVESFRREGGDASAGFLRPPGGVYTYEGTGTEKLSVLDTSQQWGPTVPATVARGEDNCWTFRLEYSNHHAQEWDFCPNEGALTETGGRTDQSFDFVATVVSDHQEFVCSPPVDSIRLDAEAQARWSVSCAGGSESRGTSVTSAGTRTFVGLEELEVAGDAVPTYHYRDERTLTGDQSGTEQTEIWYSARDGLPVRIERTVDVDTPSPFGDITYAETGTLNLTSLEPRR